MVETLEKKPEQNFLTRWLLVCAIGYAIGGSSSVVVGETIGYYLGDQFGLVLNVPQELRQSITNLCANFLLNVVSGGVINFFQWIGLRSFISDSKWWILAGIIGTSVGTVINSITISSIRFSVLDESQYFMLAGVSLLILLPVRGFIKGFLEWLILRREFPNSTRWIVARVITNIITGLITLFAIYLMPESGTSRLSRFFVDNLTGILEGVIFGVITGLTLRSFFDKKNVDFAT